MTYIVFGDKTKEYKTAKATFASYKRAAKAGFRYQIWRKYPDGSMTRWL